MSSSSSVSSSTSTSDDPVVVALLLFACLSAAASGAAFPASRSDWYRTLAKPWWTPPRLVFPVVWTTLYVLLAVAGARIAAHPRLLAAWSTQIALNTLWTPVFFGAHALRASLVVLGALWLVVAALVAATASVDALACAVFTAYLAWLSVAASLNAWIFVHNDVDGTPLRSAAQRR